MKKNSLLLFSLVLLCLSSMVATASEAARAAAILPNTTILLTNQDVPSQGDMATKIKSLSQEDNSVFSTLGQKAASAKAGRFVGVTNLLQNVFKDTKDCKSLFMQICATYPQSNDFCILSEVDRSFTLEKFKEQLIQQAAKNEQKLTIQDGKAEGIPFVKITQDNDQIAIAIVDDGKTFLVAPEKVLLECLTRYQGKQSPAALGDRMVALKATAKIPATAVFQLLVDITPDMQKRIAEKSKDPENPMVGATMDPFSKLSGFAMVCSLEEKTIDLKLLFQAEQEADVTVFKNQVLDGMIVAMAPILTAALNLSKPPDFVTNLHTSQEGTLSSLTTSFSISDLDALAKFLKQMAETQSE